MAERAERVFYSEGGIVVSTSRVSIDGDNYFVRQIATSKVRLSVRVNKMKDFLRKLAIAGSLVFGIGIGVSSGSVGVGIFLAVAGVIASILFIKPTYLVYYVVLGTSSGEMDVYPTRDREIAHRIRDAVNEAISMH